MPASWKPVSAALGQAQGEDKVADMLRGFSAGLRGLRDVKAPPSWGATYAKLYGTPLATQIAQILGDTGAATAMLATLDNAKAKTDARARRIARACRPGA